MNDETKTTAQQMAEELFEPLGKILPDKAVCLVLRATYADIQSGAGGVDMFAMGQAPISKEGDFDPDRLMGQVLACALENTIRENLEGGNMKEWLEKGMETLVKRMSKDDAKQIVDALENLREAVIHAEMIKRGLKKETLQ